MGHEKHPPRRRDQMTYNHKWMSRQNDVTTQGDLESSPQTAQMRSRHFVNPLHIKMLDNTSPT